MLIEKAWEELDVLYAPLGRIGMIIFATISFQKQQNLS